MSDVDIVASRTAITWKGKKALLGFIRNISGRSKMEEGGGKKKDTYFLCRCYQAVSRSHG
jgi:hypothetical protein